MTIEDNRNGNDNIIIIEFTEDLKQLEIVTNFIFDRKSKKLILSLNHKYKKKPIISTVFQHNGSKTTRQFMCQMTSKDMTENHMKMFCATMGTGTTGIAALKLKRRFVGIEQNEDMLAIARQNISNHLLGPKVQGEIIN